MYDLAMQQKPTSSVVDTQAVVVSGAVAKAAGIDAGKSDLKPEPAAEQKPKAAAAEKQQPKPVTGVPPGNGPRKRGYLIGNCMEHELIT